MRSRRLFLQRDQGGPGGLAGGDRLGWRAEGGGPCRCADDMDAAKRDGEAGRTAGQHGGALAARPGARVEAGAACCAVRPRRRYHAPPRVRSAARDLRPTASVDLSTSCSLVAGYIPQVWHRVLGHGPLVLKTTRRYACTEACEPAKAVGTHT